MKIDRWLLAVLVAAMGCQTSTPLVDIHLEREGQPTLFVRVVGSGPDTAVVLHGGGLHHGYLREPLAFLERDRTLVFIDQRGRGRSDVVVDSTRLTLSDDVADLEAVRGHFKLGHFALIGHHWGGVVAAHYAAAHPDRVSRILLVSPFPVIYSFVFELVSVVGDSAKYRELLSEAGRSLDTASVRGECAKIWPIFFAPLKTDFGTPYNRLADSMCNAPADRLVQSPFVTRAVQRNLGQWAFRSTLNGIAAPALVVEGGGDPTVDEAATRWAQHLPQARVLLLSRPYLFPWVGNPSGFRKAVNDFLDGEWPAGSIAPPPWRMPAAESASQN